LAHQIVNQHIQISPKLEQAYWLQEELSDISKAAPRLKLSD
jgi:hypothetical protein